jgi:hypothetical protein
MKRATSGICTIILCILFAVSLGAQENGPASRTQAPKASDWHAMGSSPCAWWLPVDPGTSGFDVSEKVNQLRSDGFQCEVFVVEGSSPQYSFGNFPKLLEATKDTSIATWIVIVPPAEGGADTLPYRLDYVAWSRAFAKLSLKYKNLRGFNIDDYINSGINGKTFTREYGCKIYAAAKQVNPRFLFVPTIYDLDRAIADRLAGCVDGVMLWWVNLESTGGLRSILEYSRYAVDGRFPVYGGVYAHWTSWHKEGNPSPAVFKQTLEDTCKYTDGAVIWQLSLNPADPLLAVAKTFLPGGSSIYAGKCGTGSLALKH